MIEMTLKWLVCKPCVLFPLRFVALPFILIALSVLVIWTDIRRHTMGFEFPVALIAIVAFWGFSISISGSNVILVFMATIGSTALLILAQEYLA